MDTNFEKAGRDLWARRNSADVDTPFVFVRVHSRFKIKNRPEVSKRLKGARAGEAHFRTLIYKVGALR